MAERKLAICDLGERSDARSALHEPVQDRPRVGGGDKRRVERLEPIPPTGLLGTEQLGSTSLDDAAGATPALVEAVLNTAKAAVVRDGLTGAVGADVDVEPGIAAEAPVVAAGGTVRLRGQRPVVALGTNGPLRPLCRHVTDPAAMRALLGPCRAARLAEHEAFAFAAAVADPTAPLTDHDRSPPADATEIWVIVPGQPNDRPHASAPPAGADGTLVAVGTAWRAVALTSEGERSTHRARCWRAAPAAGAEGIARGRHRRRRKPARSTRC